MVLIILGLPSTQINSFGILCNLLVISVGTFEASARCIVLDDVRCKCKVYSFEFWIFFIIVIPITFFSYLSFLF